MRRALVAALAVMLVLSPIVPFAAVGPATAAPAGMATIPDTNVAEDVPDGETLALSASELEGGVLASDHADSLEVILTTAEHAPAVMEGDTASVTGDGMAVVLRDDAESAGREVALDAGKMQEALGYRPRAIHGTHEDGSEWTATAEYTDGYLVFDVPHFSDNTVTFSGSVDVSMDSATSGTTATWQLSDYDAASDVTINTTGVSNSGTVTESGSSSGTKSIDVVGTQEPTGPAGGEPQMSVEMAPEVYEDYSMTTTEYTIPSDWPANGYYSIRQSNVVEVGNTDVTFTVYVNGNEQASVTKSATYDSFFEWYSVDTFQYPDISAGPGDTITVSSDVSSRDPPQISGAETKIPSTGTTEISTDAGQSATITDGGSKPLDLTGDETTLDITQSGDPIDSWSLEYDATVETVDPVVELNGNSTTIHSGTLGDGETATATIPKEQLQEGENSLNLSLGDDSLSADAPEMRADVEASHEASDKISVGYSATTFEESYNVTHTYAAETSDAQVTIPFESSRVVGVKNVEYQIDDGGWERVSADNYRFDGTTVDIYVGDAVGGSVPAGSTVDVRATGRKMSVGNGEVTITDPTAPHEELDTQLQIDERSEDFHVNVGPTDDGNRVHYAYSDMFPTEDYVVIDSSGDQKMYLPNSKTGDQFRVKHLETRVVAEQGDVRIDVVEPGENPELDVSPGPGGDGDPVTVEYYNTESGVKYLLNSLARSIVVDSDVAQSPAIFEDDDSEDTWQILRDSGTSSGSDGGGAIGQFTERAGATVGSINAPSGVGGGQLLLLGLLGIGGSVAFRRFEPFGGRGVEAGEKAAQTAGSGTLSGLQGLLGYMGKVVSVVASNRRASVATGVVAAIVAARVGLFQLPDGVGILIVVSGVPIASYLVLRRSDAVSQRVWLASTLVAVVLGLEFVAPGTVQTAIEQLTSEQVAPLLILVGAGGLYLWYRARQSDRPVFNVVTRRE
ncbi:hypothetical protein EXE53_19210 [Halorubrum sp. SD626R]|uniref:hypothetical protein n=1 Tax=Halorubrum sp. SD626R TaxID=1419722 RepID=UPI0010F51A35|nr:hypothetical protein [Halorubrum sp. SD626R]TKX78815.1 hypothetical protein EXE53_19210 [Halorubrum sp. SD626R]